MAGCCPVVSNRAIVDVSLEYPWAFLCGCHRGQLSYDNVVQKQGAMGRMWSLYLIKKQTHLHKSCPWRIIMK